MSDGTLGIGDIVCMRIIKPRFDTAEGKLRTELTYRAPKGEKFVLLLLGTVANGTEQDFDPDAALEALGWTGPLASPGLQGAPRP